MSSPPFESLLNDLLRELHASRITLRARADGSFPVIAEVVAPNVATIAGNEVMDPRKGATLQWVLKHRRTLVQDDCERAEVPPPRELLKHYGLKSQIVAPVVDDDDVIGCISVHCAELRQWAEDDVQKVDDLAVNVRRTLKDHA